jgi:hypothetical protein
MQVNPSIVESKEVFYSVSGGLLGAELKYWK